MIALWAGLALAQVVPSWDNDLQNLVETANALQAIAAEAPPEVQAQLEPQLRILRGQIGVLALRLGSGVQGENLPQVMSPDEYDELYAMLVGKTSNNKRVAMREQLQILQDYLQNKLVRVSQIRSLLTAFSRGDAQVQAAAVMYDYTLDPQNFHNVIAFFPYSSDRKALQELIGAP